MSMLAERKRKTKWVINPTKKPLWNSDSSGIKFGKELMEKMGWTTGKGLGVNEQGIQEPLRVSYKNDTKGVGFKGNDNDWIEQQDEFNELLNQLRSDNSSVIETSKEERVIKSLEEKSKQSKARVHYQKFTRGKDLSRYSDNDLACILGINKMKKEKSKTEDIIQTEPKVVGNCETSFGVTTINSGFIQDYFKKKWSNDKKVSNNKVENASEISCENCQKEEFYFVKCEHTVMSESEKNKFKKKKRKSDLENLCINGGKTFELGKLESFENNVKNKKKNKEFRESNVEEVNINKRKNYDDDITDKNLLKNENHLNDVLNYEESKDLTNMVSDYNSLREIKKEKVQLSSDAIESEKNDGYIAKKKQKINNENNNTAEVSFYKKPSSMNVKFTLEEEITDGKKKQKSKKRKFQETNELKKDDSCYTSEASLGHQNDGKIMEYGLEIDSVQKKKEKEEKYLSKKNFESKYFITNENDHGEEKINEVLERNVALDIDIVKKKKKKKCKKEKSEQEESINCHSGCSEKFNFVEELKEKNISTNEQENTLEIQAFRNKKKKKDKAENFDEKEKANVELNCGHAEKLILEGKFSERNISKIIFNTTEQENLAEDESFQKRKKKKDKKEKKKEEKRETENISYCTDHVVKMQVQENTPEAELSEKKKKNKKKSEKLDKKEKLKVEFICDHMGKSVLEGISKETNVNNINIDSTKTESVNNKKDEKNEKFVESKEIEYEEESCKHLTIENKAKVHKHKQIKKPSGIMIDRKLDLSNNNKNNAFHFTVKYKMEEDAGVHKHKMELLNEKRADKFYPGQHTNERVLRLIYWSNIAGFKGSNLDSVTGYGFLTKYGAKESK